MWTLVWVILGLSLVVVPIVFIVIAVKKAIAAAKTAGESAQRIGELLEERPDVALRTIYPGTGASHDQATIDRAHDQRAYIAQSRAFRRSRRLGWAMDRWHRLKLTHTTMADIPQLTAPQPSMPEGLGAVPPARMNNGTA